jgi:hypothetical protein
MIFGLQVKDVRRANRTASAVIDFMEKFRNSNTDAKGYLLSRNSKKKNPYLYVFGAGPVAGADGKYSVRINLPEPLKQFSGSRYGCWKETGLPNGFEFVGFSSIKAACDFVKSIKTLADNNNVEGFLQWLNNGDGSHRFYDKQGNHYRNAEKMMLA